jgi:hypothetical protein
MKNLKKLNKVSTQMNEIFYRDVEELAEAIKVEQERDFVKDYLTSYHCKLLASSSTGNYMIE